VFLGSVDLVVILISNWRETGPVSSRLVRFQRFSAWRTVDLKARRAGVNQGLDGDWRLVSFVMTGACLSSKEERVVLYAIKRDMGGWVMRRSIAESCFGFVGSNAPKPQRWGLETGVRDSDSSRDSSRYFGTCDLLATWLGTWGFVTCDLHKCSLHSQIEDKVKRECVNQQQTAFTVHHAQCKIIRILSM